MTDCQDDEGSVVTSHFPLVIYYGSYPLAVLINRQHRLSINYFPEAVPKGHVRRTAAAAQPQMARSGNMAWCRIPRERPAYTAAAVSLCSIEKRHAAQAHMAAV